jgi:hypothetical protein
MQPILQFAQMAWDQQAERYRKVVEGLPDEALTWQPTSAETNSVAQIVQHVFEGLPWLLGLACGAPPPTPEQLQQRRTHMWRNDPTTQQELLGIITQGLQARDAALADLDSMDLNGEVQAFGSPRRRLFLIVGFVNHSAEHLGHIELTKQLWEAQQGE